MLVLLVGQTGPQLRGHVVVRVDRFGGTARFWFARLVLPDIVHEEHKGDKRAASLSAHDGKLGRAVLRRIACLECLRPNDVSNRERSGDDRSGKGTLGVARDVGCSPLLSVNNAFARSRVYCSAYAVEDRKRCNDGVDEVNSCQNSRPVLSWQKAHQSSTDDSGLISESFEFGDLNTYPGIMQTIIHAQRWDCLRIPKPTRSVKKMLTTPDGVFIRAAF
jgi:hypothetical protein